MPESFDPYRGVRERHPSGPEGTNRASEGWRARRTFRWTHTWGCQTGKLQPLGVQCASERSDARPEL